MEGFRHQALLYRGEDEFLSGVLPFIREGLSADQPALVVVSERKVALLREALSPDAARVEFADMAEVGANPARIIPAWRQFVDRHRHRGRLRGVGEPVWPGRSADELVECQHVESLLNVAFAEGAAWMLLCPYDMSRLDRHVVEEARRSHPHLLQGSTESMSDDYRGLDACASPFTSPLPEPLARPTELRFGSDLLGAVHRLVVGQATGAGLSPSRVSDLRIAVDEVATVSLAHGGGERRLRIWQQADAMICEIRDGGWIEDPLAGCLGPDDEDENGWGRGLWLANQLCDLVQVRSFPAVTVVRLQMRLPRAAPPPEGLRILLVEDDEDFAELYRIGLAHAGHVVRWAQTAGQGLLLAAGWRPDLIVLAMGLRDHSGVEVLRWLRSDPGTGRLPVVVLSKYDESDVGLEPGTSGAQAWMVKTDVTPGQVAEWIDRNLRTSAVEA